MGADHIETHAYRVKGLIDPDTGKEKWSGYYVWPRYGYKGDVDRFSKMALAGGLGAPP